MKQRRIYISGAMTGVARVEYMHAFHEAERILKKHGYGVINPTRVWACRLPWLYKMVGYKLTLLYDLWLLITRADGIVMLPGWRRSRGAQIENFVARFFPLCGVSRAVVEEIDKI